MTASLRRAICVSDNENPRGGAILTMHSVATRDRTDTSSSPRFPAVPQNGDVLAARRTARADAYTISVVPTPEYQMARRYSEAVETVRVLAMQLQVDGWFTCNHTHFVRIAAHRPHSSRADAAAESGQNRSL